MDPATEGRPYLSAVVPVYNEEPCVAAQLGALYEALPRLGRSFEILMIDDGSTDRTLELLKAEKARHPELRVIRFLKNCGQSAAMAAGFAAARGEVAVTLDADLQDEPGDIAKLLERLESGGFDVVCGWREKRHDNWLRKISSRIANAVRNRVLGDDIIDTGCTLKVYRTAYLKKIKMFKGAHRFLPTLLKMEGARVAQVPVRHHQRLAGKSKYGVWNRLFKGSVDLLAVRWMKSRHISYQAEEIR